MPEYAHPAHLRVRDAARQRGVEIDIVVFGASTHTAQEAADAIGVQLGQIVKSLVFVAPVDAAHADGELEPVMGELEPVIALVRGTDRVDIGKLAVLSGRPALRRANASEANAATGYAIGGIPPFGHRQRIAVVMDPALTGYEQVWAAAGTASAVFAIAPAALARLSEALVAACAEDVAPAASSPTVA